MSGTMMDVFNGDAFSSVTLTRQINENFPFTPTLLRSMPGLVTESGITTTTAAFEEVNGAMSLIPTSPRGSPPSEAPKIKGKLRRLEANHLQRQVEINADELLNARARGLTAPMMMSQLINDRVDGPVGVRMQWGLTIEHMLLGAIDGVVLDADNSTELYDYYTWLGVSRPSAIDFPFSTMTAESGTTRTKVAALKRAMIKALNGMIVSGARLVILCGDNFYDALVGSKEYVKARQTAAFGNQRAAEIITENSPVYDAVDFAGAIWINYRGTDDGSTVAVGTDVARAFMTNVPGLFQVLYAPADTFETVSSAGLPMYILRLPENQTSKRAVWELQSNPLIACLRPLSLYRLTKS